MAYTLPGCLVGYIIVALLFRKFFQVNLGWGRGILVFVAGWVLATVPGWVDGGKRAYEHALLLIWPILSYGLLFFFTRMLLRRRTVPTDPNQKGPEA